MQMNTQDSKWTLAGVWMVCLTIGGSTEAALQLLSQALVSWL